MNGSDPSNAGGRGAGHVPDGTLCSAGGKSPYDFSAYDAARADRPGTHLTSGATIQAQYGNRAAHPGDFRVYVTKAGWAPVSGLRWADLDLVQTVTAPPRQGSPGTGGGHCYWDLRLPSGRSGDALVFIQWVRSDSRENFFSCSDVVFDGGRGEMTGIRGQGSSSPSPSPHPDAHPHPRTHPGRPAHRLPQGRVHRDQLLTARPSPTSPTRPRSPPAPSRCTSPPSTTSPCPCPTRSRPGSPPSSRTGDRPGSDFLDVVDTWLTAEADALDPELLALLTAMSEANPALKAHGSSQLTEAVRLTGPALAAATGLPESHPMNAVIGSAVGAALSQYFGTVLRHDDAPATHPLFMACLRALVDTARQGAPARPTDQHTT